MQTLEGRFWTKVDVQGSDDCWLWTGGKVPSGYGSIWVAGKMKQAHRVSWMLAHGEIPEGMCCCHRCDVPLCVNPGHLFLGTIAENNADMARKGRGIFPPVFVGSKHPRSKLVESQVIEIRRLYAAGGVSQRALGIEFGVAHTVIGAIVRREKWKHV